MSVALLLITHDNVGQSLFTAAVNMMGTSPINCKNLVIDPQMDIEQGVIQARQFYNELNKGDGVLVITDIFGSTPSNIATRLMRQDSTNQTIVVTGLNLPMLVRVMNYAHLNLSELARKAGSSASDSIFIIDHSISCD
ncbi:MAG: PTS fructose transporter subunit IIA [gamma proteobacterium symbiont of Taylorina sp.]|nr:PTS fructose transporter subunit IIA [gamma proteobacterium symbiont of Taylorina sp.]